MMISKRPRVYIAVAAVIVAAVVPATLVSTRSAGASTAACGSPCTSPSVQSLGTGEVLTVSGSSVVMSAASTSSSAQDWTVEAEGGVPNAVTAGVLSAKLLMNYSNGDLVEFQYAPNGVPSDECLANTATLYNSGDYTYQYVPTLTVVLAQCGITAQSLWIIDTNNETSGYVDLINAGWESDYAYGDSSSSDYPYNFTSPFAEPAVLTVSSSSGSGGSSTSYKVVLAPLSEIGGVVSSSQMWTAYTAPDQSALRAQIAKAEAKAKAK
jgi:hypothetical protein